MSFTLLFQSEYEIGFILSQAGLDDIPANSTVRNSLIRWIKEQPELTPRARLADGVKDVYNDMYESWIKEQEFEISSILANPLPIIARAIAELTATKRSYSARSSTSLAMELALSQLQGVDTSFLRKFQPSKMDFYLGIPTDISMQRWIQDNLSTDLNQIVLSVGVMSRNIPWKDTILYDPSYQNIVDSGSLEKLQEVETLAIMISSGVTKIGPHYGTAWLDGFNSEGYPIFGTAAHCLSEGENYIYINGNAVLALVASKDDINDIAFLVLSSKDTGNMQPIPLASSMPDKDRLVASGSGPTETAMLMEWGTANNQDVLIDMKVSGGSSGGPIITVNGVFGVIAQGWGGITFGPFLDAIEKARARAYSLSGTLSFLSLSYL